MKDPLSHLDLDLGPIEPPRSILSIGLPGIIIEGTLGQPGPTGLMPGRQLGACQVLYYIVHTTKTDPSNWQGASLPWGYHWLASMSKFYSFN